MSDQPYIDARGTDGSNPALMEKVYPDGTRIALSDTEAIAAYDAIWQTQQDAATDAAAIPNWATWTEAEALAWHDTNIDGQLPVSNLTEANAVLADMENELRALVRMVVALRNDTWPGLQE